MPIFATRIRQIEQGFSGSLLSQCRTDRGGTRKKVLPCRRKSVSLHMETPEMRCQFGFVFCVLFSMFPPYFPQVFFILLIINICLIPTPGTKRNKSRDLFLFCMFFRIMAGALTGGNVLEELRLCFHFGHEH